MATVNDSSKTDDKPPADTLPDKTKDGRPIFRTSHYNKIPVQEKGAIRILKVHPGGPEQTEVQCELIPGTILSNKDRLQHKVSDVQFKPYDALSWCWGKDPPDSRISILENEVGYVKYVQPGLLAALRALRHEIYARYFWVDAICINQEYTAERNVQVEMMAEIYGRAECVRIWLGDSDPSSDLAILFIKQQILQLQHFDDLSSSTASSDKWKALLELMQRDWFSRRWVIQEVTLAKKAIIHCGKAKLAWTKFAIAVELFVEVETATHRLSEVMKTDAKYHHVPRWFEYISQLGASLLVDATGRLFRDYDYIQPESGQVKKAAKKLGKNSNISTKPEDELCYESEDDEVMSPQELASRYNQSQEGQHAKTKGQPLLTLEYLVSSMSIFNVTTPHDCIYAMVGIAKDTTPTAVNKKLRVTDHTQAAFEMFTVKKQYPVDYKASYIDICKEFIQFCVRQNISRDPSRALDVICRPWAIEIEETDDELTLPSWLPRLSKASYGMVLGPGIDGMRMGRKNADSLVGLPNVTHRNYSAAETKVLDKKTFRFRKRQTKAVRYTNSSKSSAQGEENSGVSTSSEAGNPPALANGSLNISTLPTDTGPNGAVATAHTNGSTTLVLQENDVAIPQSSDLCLNHFSLYVKGFILDTIDSVQPSSQSGSIPAAWARFAGWEQMDATPPEHFWRTLVADRGSDGKNPPVYYSRACQESFRKGGTTQGVVDTMGLIEHERNSVVAQFGGRAIRWSRNSVVAQFCRRVQAAIWNRALVRTKKEGRFGLVANDVKEKDLVCILYGCSVPVVLRRHGPKKPSVVDLEMRLELRYIVDYVVQSYKTHLSRRKIFRDKRDKDKKDYQKWELAKRKEWKKDEKWKAKWQLVRAGLVRLHEFRAWVTNKMAIAPTDDGDIRSAEEAIHSMRKYVQTVLPNIHEVAAWSIMQGEKSGTIIDHLTSDPSTPEPFRLTPDQIILWNRFASDKDWSDKWNAANRRYTEEEGFRAWSRAHKHEIGYAADRQESKKKWEEHAAKVWTREWATENSWFLCIDPFRAWLKEKGKFCGPKEVVDSKQEWEDDVEWHRKRNKEELEIESFKAWMDAKGRENPELDIAKADKEIVRFEEWRPIWRAENRNADMHAERDAWDAEWDKQKDDSKKRRLEEVKKHIERLEKRDKEPFFERWRKGWCPPTVNWQEFGIAVSYGKHWLKLVRRGKRDHVNDQGDWWGMPSAIQWRQQARAKYMRQQYGYQAPAVNENEVSNNNFQKMGQKSQHPVLVNQQAGSRKHPKVVTNGNFQGYGGLISVVEPVMGNLSGGTQGNVTEAEPGKDTKGVDDNGKQSDVGQNDNTKASVTKDDQAFDTSRPNLQRQTTAIRKEDLSGDNSTSNPDLGLTNGSPAAIHSHRDEPRPVDILQRTKTYDEQAEEQAEEKEKAAWHKDYKNLCEAPCKSRAELEDWIRKKKALYPLHWRKAMKSVDKQHTKWEHSVPKFLGKDSKFHYDLSRPKPVKDQTSSAAERKDCRFPQGHYIKSKERARLTPAEQADYMSNVKERFQSRIGDDEKWYYELLGECYVHGMMDGEAMAHQNDKGIPWTVFEIR